MTLEDIQKHCVKNLAFRTRETCTAELYDNDERKRIGFQNLKRNFNFYKSLGDKYKQFRLRIEAQILTLQEPCKFLMENVATREEWRVNNVDELLQALREGYEIAVDSMPHGNPCGEIELGRFQGSNYGMEQMFATGGSPYQKLLTHAQQRLVARAAWRRLNLAARHSVIVESLPHLKLSKSVHNKMILQVSNDRVREMVFAFYNESRQPQWWRELRSYASGLRDAANVRIYAMMVGSYLYDAIGLQKHINQAWKTDTVMSLLRNIRENEEFSLMPIVGDALEDAGCPDQELLAHYRNPESCFSLASWIFRATGLI